MKPNLEVTTAMPALQAPTCWEVMQEKWGERGQTALFVKSCRQGALAPSTTT